jgi:hypothetical protein
MRDSAKALLGMRHDDGHWCAELTADATLETDYILLQLWLYPPEGDGMESACRDGASTRPAVDPGTAASRGRLGDLRRGRSGR